MARRKETLSQRDFGYGQTRPEAVERDDTPLVVEGLKGALNTVGLTTGGLQGRPGTVFTGETEASNGIDVDLGAGRVFDVHVVEDGVIVYDADNAVAASFTSNTWDSLTGKYGSDTFADSKFWVLPDPDTSSILIGSKSYPTHALVLSNAGVWSFGLFEYATNLKGAVLQPYYPYFPAVSITPSGRTGAITVTADTAIWTSAYEGMRIRYVNREILLGTMVSSTVMNATVIEELPPSYDFTVADVSGYQVGDAVEHENLGGQGIITEISGSDISVLATELWDGFSASDKLIGPNAAQTISAQVTISPVISNIWDMQMASAVHGYPGWGAKHKGRAYLNRFPNAPNSFAASVAGRIDDFTLGPDDGDGFVETLGANYGGDLLFIISAEDLLFFSTRGLYYQPTRGGEDVTPSSIGPIPFSQIGCSSTIPVSVDDGAIFVDAVGEQIYAAVLAGDYYKSWAVQNISQYHSALFNAPKFLGATKTGSKRPEHFIFVVNDDGTAAVCQWDRAQNKIGWRPWETNGQFVSIYQAFGAIHAVVDRSIDTFSGRFRERFEDGVYLDCSSFIQIEDGDVAAVRVPHYGSTSELPVHLYGATPAMYLDGWDFGDVVLAVDGSPVTANDLPFEYPDSYAGFIQAGLTFEIRVVPWDRRSVNTQRGPRDVKRVIKTFITVQDTLSFTYEGYTFGGYRADDDLSQPPPARSEEYSAITGGRGAFIDRAIVSDRPGPFNLLKLKYRVTI